MATDKTGENENMGVKRDRFVRIVERKVTQLLDGLDSLSKCSNRKNYEYDDEDVKKIFSTIEKKVRETKQQFQQTSTKKQKWFSLE